MLGRRPRPQGKRPGAAPSRAFLEAGEALFEEAFPPLGHHFATGVEAGRDLGGAHVTGGHEDDLGSHDVTAR